RRVLAAVRGPVRGQRHLMDRDAITAALAARLVAEQFPAWGHLPVVPVAESGWDNRTFRLGDALLARLPTAEWYVAAVAKEHTWLPRLAPHLPLPIPAPVALGSPGARWPGCSPDSGDEVHVSGLDLARNPAQVHLDARAYGFAVDGRTVGLLI